MISLRRIRGHTPWGDSASPHAACTHTLRHTDTDTDEHSRRRRWLLLAVPPWVLALSYPPLLFDKAQPCAQCAR